MSVDPTRAQFAAMMRLPQKRPIAMLNLIRFRDQAVYPPDHEMHAKHVSGREAYRRYGEAIAPLLGEIGGKMLWSYEPESVVIGPEAPDYWHACFVAYYPSSIAFATFIQSPLYKQSALPHRTAAVQDSRLIRLNPTGSSKL